jgi:hypothetical protein
MLTRTLGFDTFEVLYEFNKNIHHGVLCLEALTKHDGFDGTMIRTLAADVIKAKAAANAYLIAVIGAAEGESAAAEALAHRRNGARGTKRRETR